MDNGSHPDISVIIVHYHAKSYLEQCLRSVYAHAGGLFPEVVVVDNGSCDGELRDLAERYPDVKFMFNQDNVGFVAATNQGIAASTADVILLLNPDAGLTPGAMERLYGYLRRHDSCGVVGPQLVYPDGKLQHSHFPFPGIVSITIEHLISVRLMRAAESLRTFFPHERTVDVIRGTCMMVARRTMSRVGGLNSKLFMFSEETDLCFKIRKLNLECVFLPAAKVIHHESKSMQVVPNEFVLFHYFRSRILFLRENYPARRAALCVRIIRYGLELKKILYGVTNAREKYHVVSRLVTDLAPLFAAGK